MAPILLTGQRGYLGACIASELTRRRIRFTGLPGRLEDVAPGSLRAGIVIHTAGALRHRTGEADGSNRVGTEALLAGLAAPTPVIFVSSRSVYAPRDGDAPLRETDQVGPVDSYGLSKWQAERRLATSGHPFVIVRPTTLIGLGVDNVGRSFLSMAARTLVGGGAVTLFAPDRVHDHLDVQTLACALIRVAMKPALIDGGIFNVAGPVRGLHETMSVLAQTVSEQCLATPELHLCSGPPARTPPMSSDAFVRRYGPLDHPSDANLFQQLVEFLVKRLQERSFRELDTAGEMR